MKKLLRNTFVSSVIILLLFTLIFGLIYPLVVRGLGFAFFPDETRGSLLKNASGQLIGSSLIGQNFSEDKYFHPRPSYAGVSGYDAISSDASFLGPTSKELINMIGVRCISYRAINSLPPSIAVPADAVMSSASGLDPHISMDNAKLQMGRVAKARNLSEDQIKSLLDQFARKSWFTPNSYINVLEINLQLDKISSQEKPYGPK